MQKSEFSTGEVAELIGVHPNTVRNYAERGAIDCRRLPAGHRRFPRREVVRFLESTTPSRELMNREPQPHA